MLKAVKGATKPKVAAPKAKYIEPIIGTTFRSSSVDFREVFDALDRVISHGASWTTVYKALIVLHIMIREGEEDVTLEYLARHPRILEVADDVCRQTVGLAKYSRYLSARATQFKDTKCDYVRYRTRSGHTRLHNLGVNKGLLRECESVIVQVDALLKVHFEEQDVDNDVVLMAFRLLVHDLLSLFQCLNEGVINLLEHFFELSHVDAEQALDVYRGFTRLTTKVVQFLRVAKSLEFQTKFHIPNIKHAPTSLVSSLEMYLNDPDFETNRRQYLAEKQAHIQRNSGELRRPLAHNRSQSNIEQRTASESRAAPPQTQVDLLSTENMTRSKTVSAQPGVNPFLTQAQQSYTQAAQIQLEQNQAQLRLQQLQLQQAQAQVQAQVQAQQMNMYSQPILPQQQPVQQPLAMQTPPLAVQQQPTGFDFGQPTQFNPFVPSQPAAATNPFAKSSSSEASTASIRPVTPQMTAQATGTNPFRYSLT